MAVVYDWQWFEGDGELEAIVAICQVFVWLGFWLFFIVSLLRNCGLKCYIKNIARKCTLKSKYGLGSTTLQLQLTKIPIRD